MRIGRLLLCAAFVGSGAQGYSDHSSLASTHAAHASSTAGPRAGHLRSPSDEELILQGYPWSLYRRYPPAIRPLLRRADLEHARCNTNPGISRACNRMDRIVRQLERRGWCWGSVDPMASEAEKTWLRCSRLPPIQRGH
jgi:hypothetical protein